MACRICGYGSKGGYECPTCDCDYCEKHLKEASTRFPPKNDDYGYDVIDGKCEQCGDEE